MKKIVLLVLAAFTLGCCNKDDDSNASLPPATQTGAGTFACYVNGEAFIDTSGGWFNCFYQYVDGEYYFSISGDDEDYKYTSSPWSVNLGTIKKTISEGEILILNEIVEGNAGAVVGFSISSSNYQISETSNDFTGELTITKLDFTNHIVSGTFWFNITNPYTGERIEIREGRFDTLFTE
ncbi:hypothetical protein [Flavobacterium sp. U410]